MRFLALSILALGFPTLATAQAPDAESAWEALLERNPAVENVSPLEREILLHLTPEQADAYLQGADPSEIVLLNGETLAAFIDRKGSTNFEITWYSMDGSGGTKMQGGDFSLTGIAGEPDVGVMSGGDFALEGGFLSGVDTIPPLEIFSDGFESGNTNAWSSKT